MSAQLNTDTFTHIWARRCCDIIQFTFDVGDKRSSRIPISAALSGKNNLQLAVNWHSSLATCKIKTTTTPAPVDCPPLSLPLEDTLLGIQRGRGKGYYFVREYFQLTKEKKCSASLGNSRWKAKEVRVTLAVSEVLTQVTLSDVWCSITEHTAHLLDCVTIKR